MNDIWSVITEIATKLHPDTVEAIAFKIAKLASQEDFSKIKKSLPVGLEKEMVASLEKAWNLSPEFKPLELAAALRGASATAKLLDNQETIELVWTGPRTELIASRHTEQVLLEVVSSAKYRLFIVSFVTYDIDSVVKAVQKSIDMGVQVDILLESSKSHGGKVDIDSIKSFKKILPAANIYGWTNKSKTEWKGSVHAKCVVADDQLAFITSANLTGFAMEKNMELGVLVRGGNLPNRLDRHLNALITAGIIEKV